VTPIESFEQPRHSRRLLRDRPRTAGNEILNRHATGMRARVDRAGVQQSPLPLMTVRRRTKTPADGWLGSNEVSPQPERENAGGCAFGRTPATRRSCWSLTITSPAHDRAKSNKDTCSWWLSSDPASHPDRTAPAAPPQDVTLRTTERPAAFRIRHYLPLPSIERVLVILLCNSSSRPSPRTTSYPGHSAYYPSVSSGRRHLSIPK